MIRTINASRMEAIVELVKLILQGDITVLAIDRRFFRHNVRRFRFIATPNISLDRKRRTLLGNPRWSPDYFVINIWPEPCCISCKGTKTKPLIPYLYPPAKKEHLISRKNSKRGGSSKW